MVYRAEEDRQEGIVEILQFFIKQVESRDKRIR